MSASLSNEQKPNVAEMVVIHKVFRREFVLMPQLIRQVPDGDVARAQVLAGYARQLLERLHDHHLGEDELLWPKLLERSTPDRELIEKMQAQRRAVFDSVQRVNEQLAGWEVGGTRGTGPGVDAEGPTADLVRRDSRGRHPAGARFHAGAHSVPDQAAPADDRRAPVPAMSRRSAASSRADDDPGRRT